MKASPLHDPSNQTGLSTVDALPTETAGVFRRRGRQTLIVVGGFVAGIAIAWSISSGSVCAEATCAPPRLPPPPTPAEFMYAKQQRHQPVSDVVCGNQQNPPATADWTPTARAADDVNGSVTNQFVWIPENPTGVLGRNNRPSGHPTLGRGAHEPRTCCPSSQHKSRAAVQLSTVSGGVLLDPDLLVPDGRTPVGRSLPTGLSRRGRLSFTNCAGRRWTPPHRNQLGRPSRP
jgi:hypothetical protein